MAAEAFVSRAGAKLAHALEAFKVDVAGLRCADFGCNVGGFTDCLLKAGAARVTAIDTGYGALAWTLRNDPRVEVRERTNALHAPA
ncbi:MAG: SAM-dependent methyltransferase, partial [Phycisphaerales bacterium]